MHWSGSDDPLFISACKKNPNNIILYLVLHPFHQVNLEPEGKIYISISLTGSFTDGKYLLMLCISSP